MTHILKLVMSGFKSFGKHTELNFDENFSCILGPNGSGKSNVLDALCFVLGRISSKSLRTEKLGHLVYNGGKSKQPASKGEVTIVFDNKDKVFPVNGETVKISRIVKPNGQSIYRINDKKHTRQQVLELMNAAKIDPDGYNIVLQGDIAHFVEMSSEERRLIVEDIAGIGVYEDKKQKALRELERVEGRLKEAEILLSERKAHLKELRQDRDQAMRYKEVADKIKAHKATYLYAQIERKEKENAELDKSINDYRQEIGKAQKEIESLKRKSEEYRQQIQEFTREIDERGETGQVQMHKSLEELRVSIGTAKNRIFSIDSELEKLGTKKTQLLTDNKDVQRKVTDLQQEKASHEVQLKTKERELKDIESSLDSFRKKHDMEGLAEIEQDVDKVEKDSEAKQAEIQKLIEERQALLREKDRLELTIAGYDASIDKVQEIEKEHRKEIEQLKKNKEDFKRILVELNKLLNDDSSLAAQLGTAKRKLESLQEELAKVRARDIGIKEQSKANVAVQKILEQKNKIPGIYGTVAELGTVTKKYSAAMEVAAGPRLSSIVVESDDTGARCIKYLYENKLGRATFLPLNKIRSTEDSADIKSVATSKGVHGLAIELVKFEPRFRKVFNYVFGNTLVVENIDVARRLGIGKYRMVTLNGDLTELSGAMHGGFRHRKPGEGGFTQEEVASELKNAEKQEADYQELVESLNKRKKEAEDRIYELRKTRAELEGSIIKGEKALHLDTGELDATRKKKEEFSKDLEGTDSKLDALQEKISLVNRELASIKVSRQELRGRISELRNPTLLAELNTFEQKRRELLDEILTIKNSIKNTELQSSQVFGQETKRIGAILKEIGRDENSFAEEKSKLKTETASNRKELAVLEKKAEKFFAENKKLFSEKDRAVEILQKTEDSLIRKEEGIRVIEVKQNNISLKHAELAGELAGLNTEFEEYRDVQLIKNKSEEELKSEVASMQRSLSGMGNVNLKALEIYDAVEKQYNELLGKKELLGKEHKKVLDMIAEVETKKTDLFMNSFNAVNEKFQEIFGKLSTKGTAHLELENKEAPLEAGVEIKVRITGNKFLDIRSLSGGEKTLTALAMIFAIQEHEPASFYIMDEVDASLDKRNSEKLAQLIKQYSGKAQYIVITHNDAMISEADDLYGVSMQEDGISNVVSLKV